MAETPVCQDCCQIVKITEDGSVEPYSFEPYGEHACVSSGLLTGRVSDIVATSAMKAHPVRPSSTRLSLVPARLAAYGNSPHRSAAASAAMPAPKWLPQWEGRCLASVLLPASGRLGVWIPGYSKTAQAYRVQDVTQRNVTSNWSAKMECWTVNGQHFLNVANTLMQRHKMVLVGREYNPREKCTESCKGAQRPFVHVLLPGKEPWRREMDDRLVSGWRVRVHGQWQFLALARDQYDLKRIGRIGEHAPSPLVRGQHASSNPDIPGCPHPHVDPGHHH
ncbi:hypothetical protein ABTX34_00900 [Streptomyces sp. NPDC096538]|uniref:hypothetical protein n=1 Tax=Streptomyces sp. NPDC096538 TaxID=3155427 RepID=UPI003324BDB5